LSDRRPRKLAEPQPGFWLVRAVKGGPLVPARIYWCDHEPGEPDNKLDRWPLPFLAAELAGKVADVERVWTMRGIPISEDEYRYRVADQAWARAHAPEEPVAQPYLPIDPLAVKPPL